MKPFCVRLYLQRDGRPGLGQDSGTDNLRTVPVPAAADAAQNSDQYN